ncbi:adenylyltransferase/sulfurtransferase MoeZ [Calidifontibacter sp. DB0510]|uniref:Adenylyltransferase/sulfurtransferase MoeZ n=2 Tax=Metallococcus carri TaxID=1656884 RepID=A0A967EHX5_9MICO|nr:adenylyltransferase/sulfurtransferase MoeZ [Metallococcus carri]NOP38062.1 adenylyltransferase/sulfurtransferase MoeZ [Calidifontibacter sp. DB2511S]
MLPSIGADGQRRLKAARVLSIGAGGLGSPSLLYLAAAGVGTLGVVDDDRVDASNLQRQIIHDTSAIGRPKVASAAQRIAEVNPLVTVEQHDTRLTSDNALEILSGYDLVLDGCDNFATRYLVADAAEILGLPVVWGSLLREHGQVSVFWSGEGPAYRDLFPEMPDPRDVPSCAEAGVLGATCAAIGAAMAGEAIKLITGSGRPLLGRLQVHDALQGTWRELAVRPDPTRTPVTQLAESYEFACAPMVHPMISATELDELLAARDRGEEDFTLLDVRTQVERDIAQIPGSVLVPSPDILDGSVTLDRDVRYVVHCQSGMRSARVAEHLIAQGYAVRDVDGGIVAWQEAQAARVG